MPAISPSDRVNEDEKLQEEIHALGERIGRTMVELSRQKSLAKRLQERIDDMVDELDDLISNEKNPTITASGDASEGKSEEIGQDVGDGETGDVAPTWSNWEEASIAELQAHGLKNATCERLMEFGINTIGQLERLRAKVGNREETWPKGIGPAKVTQIEDSVIAWLTKNRDSEIFSSVASVDSQPIESSVPSVASDVEQAEEEILKEQEASDGPVRETPAHPEPGEPKKRKRAKQERTNNGAPKNPPVHQQGSRAAEWDALSDADRDTFLVNRIAELASNPVAEYVGEFKQIFEDGQDARRSGAEYGDVNWIPGPHQNAWLAGWIKADAVLSGMDDEEPQPNEAAAIESPVLVNADEI